MAGTPQEPNERRRGGRLGRLLLVGLALIGLLAAVGGVALAARPDLLRSLQNATGTGSGPEASAACAVPEYEDYAAHLASRGATPTCADFLDTVASYGSAADADEAEPSSDDSAACPEAGFAEWAAELQSQGLQATCDDYYAFLESGSQDEAPAQDDDDFTHAEVPDLIGLDPNSAARLLQSVGLRLANGGVGAYGVVSSQSPRAGTVIELGRTVMVSVNYGQGGGGSSGGGTRCYQNAGGGTECN